MIGAIERLGRPVSLRRKTPGGSWDDAGNWTASDFAEPETITAVEQPVGAEDLRNLPEGIRVAAMWKVWTRADVKEGDRMTINGAEVKVIHVAPWRTHNECIAGWE